MVRTRGLSWAMFWAVVSYIVTTLGAALTEYLTSFDLTPVEGAFISTGVGLGVVMLGVLIDQAKQGGGGKEAVPAPPPSRPVKRTSWAGAILLTILLCGGGGLAVTYAGHWVVGKAVALVERATGADKDDPGRERLQEPATATKGTITITVTSVQVNERATVVHVTAGNSGDEAVTLSGGGGGQLNVPGQGTLKRDPFAGDWDQGEVPAGGEYSGTIVFDGRIGQGATAATLAFPQIFSMDRKAPNNMSVDLALLIEATAVRKNP